MADNVARREARIRKILENSSSRLKKITNATDTSTDNVPSSSKDKTVALKEKVTFTEVVPAKDVSTEENLNVIFETNRQNSTSVLALEVPANQNAPVRYVLIVLLAVFVRHIILMANFLQKMDVLVYYRLNNIFLPFFTMELIDFMFCKPFKQQCTYLNVLYLFNIGLRPDQVSNLITVAQITLQFSQDIMIYMFAFVCFGGVIDVIAS